jgi:hypothetical protein
MPAKLFLTILSNNIPSPMKNSSSLIKVCAWCPKKDYPQLQSGQDYTHGMCHKHYRELSIKKDLAISLLIAELIERTRSKIYQKRKDSFKRLHTSVKQHLQKLQ